MNPERKRQLQEAWSLDRAGRQEPALAAYRAFLEAEPRSAVGWADLGGLLLVMGRLEEAGQACARALAIDPRQLTAQVNLAAVRLGQDRLEEAQALGRGILAQDPRCVPARVTLGHCLFKRGDRARARAELERALELEPGNRIARTLLKNIAILESSWPELRKAFERDLADLSGPLRDHEQAHLHLLFGELAEGWRLNEARLQVPGLIRPVRSFAEPRWDGRLFPGRTLLLHHEQGFGDTLMFLRYTALAKARGGRVVVSVQPELAALAATCAGVDQVVPHGDPLPPFDLQLSLVSLPLVFQTDLGSIPAEIPYLAVPDLVPNRAAIAGRLAASAGKVRVGLAWAGNPAHKKDLERSLPVAALAPLGALPGVAWHSFQVGQGPAAPLPGLVPLAPLLADFSATAYALTGMDLVISVDTALAHLAGALGVPTLLLLPFTPDFRWLLEREDSPWYPTLHLYRQPQPGDWASVIGQLLHDLGGPA